VRQRGQTGPGVWGQRPRARVCGRPSGRCLPARRWRRARPSGSPTSIGQAQPGRTVGGRLRLRAVRRRPPTRPLRPTHRAAPEQHRPLDRPPTSHDQRPAGAARTRQLNPPLDPDDSSTRPWNRRHEATSGDLPHPDGTIGHQRRSSPPEARAGRLTKDPWAKSTDAATARSNAKPTLHAHSRSMMALAMSLGASCGTRWLLPGAIRCRPLGRLAATAASR